MLYVGLTEEHRESASLFADVVGSQILSQVVLSNATAETKATRSGSCKFLTFVFISLIPSLFFLRRTKERRVR